jgi:NUP50 (Nucleoporin 50 kDa)
MLFLVFLITQEEVDALNDRESEESGVFARASSDEMAKRKILKVKR